MKKFGMAFLVIGFCAAPSLAADCQPAPGVQRANMKLNWANWQGKNLEGANFEGARLE